MTTPAASVGFRVVSIIEAGLGRVNVNFTASDITDPALGASPGASQLTLNLSPEEASVYFPGQVYDFTITERA